MTITRRYVTIAVPGPARRTFTYALPEGMDSLSEGQRVLVSFGKKRVVGFYLGSAATPSGIDVKDVAQVLDERPLFSPDLFALCVWMADYYFANPADCLAAALPATVKSARKPRYRWANSPELFPETKGVHIEPGKLVPESSLRRLRTIGKGTIRQLMSDGVMLEEWPTADLSSGLRMIGYRWLASGAIAGLPAVAQPFDGIKARAELKVLGWSDYALRKAIKLGVVAPVHASSGILDIIEGRPEVAGIELNEEQRAAVKSVGEAIGKGFRTFLLHGITGSGKTIVYCHLARQVVERGESVLVLTPEIALSGATLAYFRGFFGESVTVLHSAMTERERHESWQGIRSGRFKIVVGPRSALFAPLHNLGLIIVDEEHDGSYKQDDPSPRFHGRDSAIMRAKINGIPVLLGSASPSVESYYHATSGRYTLVRLTQRPGTAVLPTVRVVDMRSQAMRGDLPFASLPLKKAVEERIERDEQVILFLNRRGYAPALKCGDCGHTPSCPACKLQLTYHKAGKRLICHYCGYIRSDYDSCDNCNGTSFVFLGAGTQKVEEAIPRLFSTATMVRLDSDSASGRLNAHRILSSFARREQQILLGTQMVTKGLDLAHVSLVGVLSADLGADLPDFRSAERTFSRLLQVAGRSGRAEKPGEVIIQTYSPDAPHIADAARQDYQSFFDREIESRKEGQYPPFVRLVNVVLSGSDEDKLEETAREFAQRLRSEAEGAGVSVAVLGPAPCPLYHLRQMYRRHVLIKTNQTMALVRMLTNWENREPRFKLPALVKVVVDVDPDDMM